MKRYPLFSVCIPSEEEKNLEEIQRPILEKLSDRGFGVKITDDIFMDMPCRIDNNNYPFEIYRCIDNVLVLVKTFYSWDEIIEFCKSIP